MKYEMKVLEYDERKKDFKRYTRIDEIPDEKVRPDYLCTFCQMPSYPECKEWCPNYK